MIIKTADLLLILRNFWGLFLNVTDFMEQFSVLGFDGIKSSCAHF